MLCFLTGKKVWTARTNRAFLLLVLALLLLLPRRCISWLMTRSLGIRLRLQLAESRLIHYTTAHYPCTPHWLIWHQTLNIATDAVKSEKIHRENYIHSITNNWFLFYFWKCLDFRLLWVGFIILLSPFFGKKVRLALRLIIFYAEGSLWHYNVMLDFLNQWGMCVV